jgi:CubicO group peptidase (beta-lactamase class C family)
MNIRETSLMALCLWLSTIPSFAQTSPSAQPGAGKADNHLSAGTRISAALQPFVDRHVLAGAVALVAEKDRVVSLESVGYADIAAKKPMRTDAMFWIASQTKSITAAAVMMLVDEGKVNLDDPVEKYLPEFNGQWLIVEGNDDHMLLRKPRRAIRVLDLLTHTSGLVHFLELEDPGSKRFEILPLREATRLYALTPLRFEPGSQWKYCNAGFTTAGRIIEIVSGMPYEQFLKRRLFDPLDMHDTTFSPTCDQLARLAKSYKPDAMKRGLEETALPIAKALFGGRPLNPLPAGGLFSTAGDIARFCQMMLNRGSFQGKRILSEGAVRQMATKQVSLDDDTGYGLGWFTHRDESFEHGGAYATLMTVDPKHGQVRVLLLQHSGFPGDDKPIYETVKKIAIEQAPNL